MNQKIRCLYLIRYIEESEINLDKSIIKKMMNEVYQEACELI